MYEQEQMQLRALATSNNPERLTHYRAICRLRDTILAAAVLAQSQALLDASGYQPDPNRSLVDNYHRAIEVLEQHLSQSSIPISEQQLIALVGIGALAGWSVQIEDGEHEIHVHHSGGEELDPMLAHLLARALDRSPDQEAAFWARVEAAARTLPHESNLALAAARGLLDETPMNELDDTVSEMMIDSIMGG